MERRSDLQESQRRTSIFMPATVNANLEILALRKGLTKNQAVLLAIRALLEAEGLQPDKQPLITKVEY